MDAVQVQPFVDSRLSHARDFNECRNTESGAVFIIASGNSAKDFPLEDFAWGFGRLDEVGGTRNQFSLPEWPMGMILACQMGGSTNLVGKPRFVEGFHPARFVACPPGPHGQVPPGKRDRSLG